MSITSHDAGEPSTSKSTAPVHTDEAERLKTLQAKIEARKQQKRKRETEAEPDDISTTKDVSASPSKGKGRAVSFAEGAGIESVVSLPLTLQDEGLSQQDAFKASKEEAEAVRNAKSAKKTTAKKRYLKAKMARYKAKKRTERPGKSEAGSTVGEHDKDTNDASVIMDEGSIADTSAVSHAESAEEKRARKKAKRDERRANEAAEVEASLLDTSNVSNITADLTLENLETAANQGELSEEQQRKAERRAKKAAKRAAAGLIDNADDSIKMEVEPTGEDQPLNKRDLVILAKAEELKARQEKANKRAKSKLKHGKKSNTNDEDPEDDLLDAVPTQPDALPRFPRPLQPVAPSQRELDDLLVSHELRHATLVDQSTIVPVADVSLRFPQVHLSSQTLDRLREMSIDNFFAVQSAVLPLLFENMKLYSTRARPRDICVSAPTGSGKTLSYVIPVVEALRTRVVTRLRALVVLPTRELVMQVREVFEQFCKGTGLKVATATGQHSFASEQASLVADHDHDLHGGSSKIDILIVTPGRLMDHLKSTRNFTLQHLRFLVIDEADRLLSQNFNDWLKVLIGNIELKETNMDDLDEVSETAADELDVAQTDALAPQLVPSRFPLLDSVGVNPAVNSTQKLLFSATLTRDPAKIAALNLHDPVYIAVVEKAQTGEGGESDQVATTMLESDRNFALPDTLAENMIVTRTADKALTLLYLLYTVHVKNTICFTKSVESAARLVMLVNAFNAEYAKLQEDGRSVDILKIAHYSSELGPAQRKEVMDNFKKGDINILVCSDLAARGLDIPSIENVINYDVPVDMRKYVHRVGRTARAGRNGTAWSLVEVQEAKYFKTLLSQAGRLDKVKNVKVKRDRLSPYEEPFKNALSQLQE